MRGLQKASGSAEAATSGPSQIHHYHPTTEGAKDMRTDTIAAAPAASQPAPSDRKIINGAIDELTYARVEVLLTIEMLDTQLKEDPRTPGLTYGLTDEQVEMISHAAHLTLASIRRSLNVLEAAQ